MRELLIVLILLQAGLHLTAQQSGDETFARSLEKISQNEKQDAYLENLMVFREGHRQGWFYFIHPLIPRYEPYLDLPGFREVYMADSALRAGAIAHSRSSYCLKLPAHYDSTEAYPVVFIFHGGNSNLDRALQHWRHPVIEKEYIRVYLQSYRHTDYTSFTWRSGDERSDRDLRQLFENLSNQYSIDSGRILVAGISAGANYALAMSLRGIIPVRGLIAFCPGFPDCLRGKQDFSGLHTDLRVYYVGGELDFYREQQEDLARAFNRSAISYRYIVVDGMKHQYPEQESEYLEKALKFLNQP